MTTKEAGYRAPPSLAVSEGQTTQNPGVPGVVVWSSNDAKLLVWGGSSWQPTAAAGVASIFQSTLDFGTVPVLSKSFAIANAKATAGIKVVMTPAADSDEYEMDGFACAAYCAANGTVTAFVHALSGSVKGARKFNYIMG